MRQDQPPHPFSALFTALRISATLTCAPLGMPFAHAVASALPKAMFTIVRPLWLAAAKPPGQQG